MLPSRRLLPASALVLFTQLAQAEPPPAPALPTPDARAAYRLDYSAPEGCPPREAFEAAILRRLPAAHADDDARATHFRVELAAPGSAATSALWVSSADGSELRREVQEDSCFDVMQSMAVIVAMVLEEHLTSAAPEARPEPADGAEASTPAPPPSSPQQPLAAPPRDERAAEPAASESSRASHLRRSLNADFLLRSGIAPKLSPGIQAGLELAWLGSRQQASTLRLNGAYATSGALATRAGSAQLRLLTGKLTVSRTLLTLGALRVAPCLAIEAGQLHGEGLNGRNPRSANMPWLGVGPALRLEAELAGTLALELEGGGAALAWHDRFQFDPAATVEQVPVVVGYLAAGLRFPAW